MKTANEKNYFTWLATLLLTMIVMLAMPQVTKANDGEFDTPEKAFS